MVIALRAVVLSVLYLRKRHVITHLIHYAKTLRPEELKNMRVLTHRFQQESSRYSFGRTGRKRTKL